MIDCVETRFRDAAGEPLMERMAECVPALGWHRRDVAQQLPTSQSSKRLAAVVNGGRWIVRCPCNGAQLASLTDRRFFCVDCLNAWCGGKWARVVWPGDPGAIEAALAQRPDVNTRNWEPHETVSDLIAENVAHGVR